MLQLWSSLWKRCGDIHTWPTMLLFLLLKRLFYSCLPTDRIHTLLKYILFLVAFWNLRFVGQFTAKGVRMLWIVQQASSPRWFYLVVTWGWMPIKAMNHPLSAFISSLLKPQNTCVGMENSLIRWQAIISLLQRRNCRWLYLHSGVVLFIYCRNGCWNQRYVYSFVVCVFGIELRIFWVVIVCRIYRWLKQQRQE